MFMARSGQAVSFPPFPLYPDQRAATGSRHRGAVSLGLTESSHRQATANCRRSVATTGQFSLTEAAPAKSEPIARPVRLQKSWAQRHPLPRCRLTAAAESAIERTTPDGRQLTGYVHSMRMMVYIAVQDRQLVDDI